MGKKRGTMYRAPSEHKERYHSEPPLTIVFLTSDVTAQIFHVVKKDISFRCFETPAPSLALSPFIGFMKKKTHLCYHTSDASRLAISLFFDYLVFRQLSLPRLQPFVNMEEDFDEKTDHQLVMTIVKCLSVYNQRHDSAPLGGSLIHDLARIGDLEALEMYFTNNQQHVDVEIPDGGHDQRRPLHTAVHYGHKDVTRLLLRWGAKPWVTDAKNRTPYHYAAIGNHVSVMDVLLTMGNSLDLQENPLHTHEDIDGLTVAHQAAKYGHKEILSMLIDIGNVTVDILDKWGTTPLYVAVACHRNEVALYLLDRGANATLHCKKVRDCLGVAAMHGNEIAIHLLLGPGVCGAAQHLYDISAALYRAVESGHLGAVRLLLAHSSVSEVDADLLTLAVSHDSADLTECLSKKLLPLHEKLYRRSHRGSALHRAAELGHLNVIRTLVKCKANVEIENHSGERPLHRAAVRGHAAAMELLVALGADPRALVGGKTILHYGAKNGHVQVLKTALDRGWWPEWDEYSGSLLFCAVNYGSADVIVYLLDHGADNLDYLDESLVRTMNPTEIDMLCWRMTVLINYPFLKIEQIFRLLRLSLTGRAVVCQGDLVAHESGLEFQNLAHGRAMLVSRFMKLPQTTLRRLLTHMSSLSWDLQWMVWRKTHTKCMECPPETLEDWVTYKQARGISSSPSSSSGLMMMLKQIEDKFCLVRDQGDAIRCSVSSCTGPTELGGGPMSLRISVKLTKDTRLRPPKRMECPWEGSWFSGLCQSI